MSTYVFPYDTANGALGYCHAKPKDERGVRIDAFPVALVGHAVIRRTDKEWGDEHRDGDYCRYGMWGPNFDPENEIPWCEDGDGCRILGYLWDMRRGDTFPELVVIYRDGRWLVEDGYHRLAAWVLMGRSTVPAIAFSDDGPDALPFALQLTGVRLTRRPRPPR